MAIENALLILSPIIAIEYRCRWTSNVLLFYEIRCTQTEAVFSCKLIPVTRNVDGLKSESGYEFETEQNCENDFL